MPPKFDINVEAAQIPGRCVVCLDPATTGMYLCEQCNAAWVHSGDAYRHDELPRWIEDKLTED